MLVPTREDFRVWLGIFPELGGLFAEARFDHVGDDPLLLLADAFSAAFAGHLARATLPASSTAAQTP